MLGVLGGRKVHCIAFSEKVRLATKLVELVLADGGS